MPEVFTVLVVEDEPLLRRGLDRYLTGLGWRVLVAGDPLEAERLQERADVILSDWRMPNGGGAEVLRRAIRPVVIYTSSPEEVPEGVTALFKGDGLRHVDDFLRSAITPIPAEAAR